MYVKGVVSGTETVSDTVVPPSVERYTSYGWVPPVISIDKLALSFSHMVVFPVKANQDGLGFTLTGKTVGLTAVQPVASA